VAHVGLLSLMFAAAEEQHGGRAHLVQSLECFAMKLVSAASWKLYGCITDAAGQTMDAALPYHLQQTTSKRHGCS
jgi:hypothetical protein